MTEIALVLVSLLLIAAILYICRLREYITQSDRLINNFCRAEKLRKSFQLGFILMTLVGGIIIKKLNDHESV